MYCIARAAVDTFTSHPANPHPLLNLQSHAHAVSLLSRKPGPLQHHLLCFIASLLAAQPASISALRQMQVWEIAFGPAFFFLDWPESPRRRALSWQADNPMFEDSIRAEGQLQGDRLDRAHLAPLQSNAEASPSSPDASAPGQPPADGMQAAALPLLRVQLLVDEGAEQVRLQLDGLDEGGTTLSSQARHVRPEFGEELDRLRVRVVHLAETAASLQGITNNEMECRKVRHGLDGLIWKSAQAHLRALQSSHSAMLPSKHPVISCSDPVIAGLVAAPRC